MEVIALKSPADWDWRPSFHPDVTAGHDALERIIGKYDLQRPPPGSPAGTGMVLCGLNNCHRKHFIGFLILLKDGRETIIGQDCGAREFETSWKEVEARFRAEERRIAVDEAIRALLDGRDDIVRTAERLLPQCEEANRRVSAVRTDLHRFQGFWQQLYTVNREGGRVQGRQDQSGSAIRQGGKETRITITVIDESGLLLEDTSVYERSLRYKVIAWLRTELDTEIVAARGDLKALGEIARRSGELATYLRAAAEFLVRAEALLRRENLAKFEAIDVHMLGRTHKSNALSRVLRRLSAGGR